MAVFITGAGIPPTGLPAGYTPLNFIQSSGTQYIDTLVKPKSTTRLIAKIAYKGTAGSNICGVRNTSSDTSNRFGLITFGSANKLGAFFGTASIQAITFDQNTHDYDLSSAGLKIDGTNYALSSGSFSCAYNLLLFAWSNGTDGIQKAASVVYSCQIYDNGTLVRDFVPCINPSNVIGLYDKVGKRFYGNAGAGSFTGG